MTKVAYRVIILTFSLLLLTLPQVRGELRKGESVQPHTDTIFELSIFVIPSHRPLDWTSPSSILRSTVNSFMEASFSRKLYSIGHLFIELTNPEGIPLIRTSIASKEPSEQRAMVLKEKIGLAMLGAPVKGRMESMEELETKINRFAKKRKISFISYKILPAAAERVINFVKAFTSRDSAGFSQSDIYGGAFWPRFKGEGAGCSAFGMAALELTGARIDYPDWYVKVQVPYDLVGGKYNNGNKIRPRDILQRKYWYKGSGIENEDYYTHFIYDPSYIYNWILNQLSADHLPEGFTKSTKTSKNGRVIEGLSFDATNIKTPSEPIFKERAYPSIFAH